jgi:hypothetical protein
LSSTPTTMRSSGVPPTRSRPAWTSHGVRPGDPRFLLVNTPTPPKRCTFPQPRLKRGTRDSLRPRGHCGGNPPPPSWCDLGSRLRAPSLLPLAVGRAAHLGSRPRGTHHPPPGSAAARGGDSSGVGTQVALDCRAPAGSNEDSLVEAKGWVETRGGRRGGLETVGSASSWCNSAAGPSPAAVDCDCARACWARLPSCGQRGCFGTVREFIGDLFDARVFLSPKLHACLTTKTSHPRPQMCVALSSRATALLLQILGPLLSARSQHRVRSPGRGKGCGLRIRVKSHKSSRDFGTPPHSPRIRKHSLCPALG